MALSALMKAKMGIRSKPKTKKLTKGGMKTKGKACSVTISKR